MLRTTCINNTNSTKDGKQRIYHNHRLMEKLMPKKELGETNNSTNPKITTTIVYHNIRSGNQHTRNKRHHCTHISQIYKQRQTEKYSTVTLYEKKKFHEQKSGQKKLQSDVKTMEINLNREKNKQVFINPQNKYLNSIENIQEKNQTTGKVENSPTEIYPK